MTAPLILAIDTSAAHCAAAVLCGDEILVSSQEEMAKGQAERLLVLVQELLVQAGKTMDQLDAIGVGVGPGNFTGIRISVSAARGLALGPGIPCCWCSTHLTRLQFGASIHVCCTVRPRGATCYLYKAPRHIDDRAPASAAHAEAPAHR